MIYYLMCLTKKPTMRTKACFLLVLSFIIAFACKKMDHVSPAQEIIGRWGWIYTYSSINNPIPNTPLSTGINEILVYNSNHTWYKTQNNIKVDSGTYTIGHGSYTPYTGGIYLYL